MMRGMAVLGLYALQNGFMGFERSGLFYDEFSGDRVRIPIACWLVRTSDAMILFDTGLSPRAVPGLLRSDPLARFTEEDLLVHRLDLVGLEPDNVDMVVLSHLHFDHAGGAALFPESGPVILTGDACYWHEHADKERVPGVVWNPTLALHSLRKLKTIARLVRGRIFPGHDPIFWETVKQAPDAYR